MIQIIIAVVGTGLVVGLLLAVLQREWFMYYIVVIALILALPLSLAYLMYRSALGIGNLLFVVLKMFSKATIKTIIFFFITIPSTLAILSTTYLPRLGQSVLRLDEFILNATNLGLVENLKFARTTMVEIIVDEREIEPRYSAIELYRDKFEKTKKEGAKMLSAGDTILSISLGGLLLISQVYQLGIFQTAIYGHTAAIVIQIGLFILTLSILYRTFILDFIAFEGNKEFNSVEEADVALSYQKAVSRVATVQSLTVLILFALRISNVDQDIVKSTLRFYYRDDTNFADAMWFAWGKLRTSAEE